MSHDRNKFGGTWDKDAFDAIAKEKIAAEEDDADRLAKAEYIRKNPVQRNPLNREESRQASGQIDIEGQVGKIKMTTAKAAAADRVGVFHCPATGKTFSDHITYLDHINGKKYQKAMGMNMRVERSSLSDVKSRLKAHAVIQQEKKDTTFEERFVSLETRMQNAREDEQQAKRQRVERKQEKKEREQEELKKELESGLDEEQKEMAAMMGLPLSFC